MKHFDVKFFVSSDNCCFLSESAYVFGSSSFEDNYPSIPLPSSPFLSADWIALFSGSDKYSAIHFTVWDAQRCLFIQPLLYCKFIPFLPGFLGSYCIAPCMPYCSPVVDGPEESTFFSFFLNRVKKIFSGKVLYLEFRHFPIGNQFHQYFLESDFSAVDWCNVQCDLSVSDWESRLSKTKKKQIRRTLNGGAVVDFSPTEEMVCQYYRMQQRLYSKIHRPLPELQVFNALCSSPVGSVAVLRMNDDVLAGCSYFLFDQVLYFWYIASCDKAPANSYPAVTLYYSIMKHCAENGARRVDFMGGGSPKKNYGVRTFKLSLGGECINEYRYRKFLCL